MGIDAYTDATVTICAPRVEPYLYQLTISGLSEGWTAGIADAGAFAIFFK